MPYTKEEMFNYLNGYAELGSRTRKEISDLEAKGFDNLPEVDRHVLKRLYHVTNRTQEALAFHEEHFPREFKEWQASKLQGPPSPGGEEGTGIMAGLKSLLPKAEEWNTPQKVEAQLRGAATGVAELPALAASVGPLGIISRIHTGKTPITHLEESQAKADVAAGLDPERFSGTRLAGGLATPGLGLWGWLAKGGVPKLAAKGGAFGLGTEAARQTSGGIEQPGKEYEPGKMVQSGLLGMLVNPALQKGAQKLLGMFRGRKTGTTGEEATPETPGPEPPPKPDTGDKPVAPGGAAAPESTAANAGAAAKEVAGASVSGGKDLKKVVGLPTEAPAAPPTPAPADLKAPPKVFGPPEPALKPTPQGLQKILPGMGRPTAPPPGPPMVQGPPEPPVGPIAQGPTQPGMPPPGPREPLPMRVEPGQRTLKGMGLRGMLPREEGNLAVAPEAPPVAPTTPQWAQQKADEAALKAAPPPAPVEKPIPPKALMEAEAAKSKEEIVKKLSELRKKEPAGGEAPTPRVGEAPLTRRSILKAGGQLAKMKLGETLSPLGKIADKVTQILTKPEVAPGGPEGPSHVKLRSLVMEFTNKLHDPANEHFVDAWNNYIQDATVTPATDYLTYAKQIAKFNREWLKWLPEGTKGTTEIAGVKVIPAGVQKGFEDVPDVELFHLQQDLPGHPKGSTVSLQTIKEAQRTPGKIATASPLAQPFETTFEKGAPIEPYVVEHKRTPAPSPLGRPTPPKEVLPIDYEQQERYFGLRDQGVSAEEASKAIHQDIEATRKARLDRIDGQVSMFLSRAREAALKPEPGMTKLTHEEITKDPLEVLVKKAGLELHTKSDPVYGDTYEVRRPDGSPVVRGGELDIRRGILNIGQERTRPTLPGEEFYSGVPIDHLERAYEAMKGMKVKGGVEKQVGRLVLTPQFVYGKVPYARAIVQEAENFERQYTKLINGSLYEFDEKTGTAKPTGLHNFDEAPKPVLDHVADVAFAMDRETVKATPEMLKAAGHSDEVIKLYFGLRDSLDKIADKVDAARARRREHKGIPLGEDYMVPLKARRENFIPHTFGGRFEVYRDGKVYLKADESSSFSTEYDAALTAFDLRKAFPGSKVEIKFYPDHDYQFSMDIDHALRVGKLGKMLEEKYGAKAEDIAKLVARSGSRHDFAKHFLRRSGKEGYETEDIRSIIQGYFFNAARYIAMTDLRIKADLVLSSKRAREYLNKDTVDWLYNYIAHVGGRPTAADVAADNFLKAFPVLNSMIDPSRPATLALQYARQLTVHTKLGMMNISYPIVNLAVLAQHIWPSLSRYANEANMGTGAAEKYFAQGWNAYWGAIKGNKEDKGLVDKLVNEGVVQIHLMSQPLPRFKARSEVENVSLWLPKVTEELTRTVAAVSRYKMAKDLGHSEKESLRLAYAFVNETGGSFSKAGKPQLFRGQVGGTAFLFKTFGSIMFQNMMSNAVGAIIKKDPATAARYITAMVAVAGVIGLPAAKVADNVISSTTGFSPFEWLMDSLGDEGKALAYGVGKYAGIYLASRAGASETIPSDIKGVVSPGPFKPLWDGIVDFASNHDMSGLESGLESWLLPSAVRPFKRQLGMSGGIESGTLYNKKGQVVTEDLTPYEKIMYGLGFNPQRVGEAYDRERIIGNLAGEEMRARKNVLDMLRANPEDEAAWEKAQERGMRPGDISRSLRESQLPLEERSRRHTMRKFREMYP